MNTFEYGFDGAYGREEEVLTHLSKNQIEQYIPNSEGYSFITDETEPQDSLFEDANQENGVALAVLGLVARFECGPLNRRNQAGEDFREALVGYTKDKFQIPRKRHAEKPITIEEFEIECLEAEIEMLKVRADATRLDLSLKPKRRSVNDLT